MALSIWANTSKEYVRSIRTQIAQGKDPIERPNTMSALSTFLDKMPAQVHQNLAVAPKTVNSMVRPRTDNSIPDSSKVEI
jgi:hypothetical protein